jgi:hypothetical protein
MQALICPVKKRLEVAKIPIMPKAFHNAFRKIARAGEELAHLEREIGEFIEDDCYKIAVEPDPQNPGYELHKVILIRCMAPNLRELAARVAANLRGALDEGIGVVAAASRSVNASSQRFLFADSAKGFEESIEAHAQQLPVEIRALLRGFKPYKGGNDLLFALNLLCNAGERAPLAAIGTVLLRPYTRFAISGYLGIEIPEHPVWNRTEDEIVFLRAPADAKLDYEIDFGLFVALDKIDWFDGQPVLVVLEACGAETHRVVSRIEAEAVKLGLVH